MPASKAYRKNRSSSAGFLLNTCGIGQTRTDSICRKEPEIHWIGEKVKKKGGESSVVNCKTKDLGKLGEEPGDRFEVTVEGAEAEENREKKWTMVGPREGEKSLFISEKEHVLC